MLCSPLCSSTVWKSWKSLPRRRNLEQVFVKLVNQKTKHSSLEDLLSEMDEEAAQKSGDAPADGADTPAADADTADSTQKEEE